MSSSELCTNLPGGFITFPGVSWRNGACACTKFVFIATKLGSSMCDRSSAKGPSVLSFMSALVLLKYKPWYVAGALVI